MKCPWCGCEPKPEEPSDLDKFLKEEQVGWVIGIVGLGFNLFALYHSMVCVLNGH